jgi:hypothetical protein
VLFKITGGNDLSTFSTDRPRTGGIRDRGRLWRGDESQQNGARGVVTRSRGHAVESDGGGGDLDEGRREAVRTAGRGWGISMGLDKVQW